MNGGDVTVSPSAFTLQRRIRTALHILHHRHPKVDGGPPSDMGRCLSYGWVGGFWTETNSYAISYAIIKVNHLYTTINHHLSSTLSIINYL